MDRKTAVDYERSPAPLLRLLGFSSGGEVVSLGVQPLRAPRGRVPADGVPIFLAFRDVS